MYVEQTPTKRTKYLPQTSLASQNCIESLEESPYSRMKSGGLFIIVQIRYHKNIIEWSARKFQNSLQVSNPHLLGALSLNNTKVCSSYYPKIQQITNQYLALIGSYGWAWKGLLRIFHGKNPWWSKPFVSTNQEVLTLRISRRLGFLCDHHPLYY